MVFLAQDETWRRNVLGKGPVFALEMGRPEWWCQLTGRLDRCIGQSSFGASAPYKDVAEHFGVTPERVAERVLAAL